jgi:hypothetical protein
MALLGWEGFDNEASNIQLDLPYKPFGTGNPTGSPAAGFWWGYFGNFGVTSKQPGLLGGFAMGGNTTSGSGGIYFNSTYTRVIVGFRYRVPNIPFPTVQPCTFADGNPSLGTGTQCGLGLDANTARLFFFRGTPANLLGTGSTQLIGASWYFIEIDVTISNGAGAFAVRIDGAPEFNGVGLNTQATANAFLQSIRFSVEPPANPGGGWFDDVYVCDTTGPAPWNTFLGVIRVETFFPTNNGAVAWFLSLVRTGKRLVNQHG